MLTRGSSFLATPSFEPESRCDSWIAQFESETYVAHLLQQLKHFVRGSGAGAGFTERRNYFLKFLANLRAGCGIVQPFEECLC